ncbi:MAG: tRNA (adenosine(37)-N6)-threonylcarbamoyltransferase complex dimerization subunit type 1 TsaB [Acidobacteria bacterium]|nr:tRNA (adenosine(37)-N6)-threonylcarbamoyltransferase complex dimerization subunit type 1 TsaB [Acidobacteriota bacterium]
MLKREEPLILSIETATRSGSIAVLRGREILAGRTGDAARSHSVDLLDLIREALDEAGFSVKDVDLFAVALGPGSFTGLRIGVATVKGLASTLERKAIGVETLHAVALAARASSEKTIVVALLPAGRGELFAQSFRVENRSVVPLDEPRHVPPSVLFEKLRPLRSIRFAGEGAFAQLERLRALAEEAGVTFIEEQDEKEISPIEGWSIAALPSNLAKHVGLLAYEKHREGAAYAPEELQAIYVRPSDAELKEKCRT